MCLFLVSVCFLKCLLMACTVVGLSGDFQDGLEQWDDMAGMEYECIVGGLGPNWTLVLDSI